MENTYKKRENNRGILKSSIVGSVYQRRGKRVRGDLWLSREGLSDNPFRGYAKDLSCGFSPESYGFHVGYGRSSDLFPAVRLPGLLQTSGKECTTIKFFQYHGGKTNAAGIRYASEELTATGIAPDFHRIPF